LGEQIALLAALWFGCKYPGTILKPCPAFKKGLNAVMYSPALLTLTANRVLAVGTGLHLLGQTCCRSRSGIPMPSSWLIASFFICVLNNCKFFHLCVCGQRG
jgi:hypothetical protein